MRAESLDFVSISVLLFQGGSELLVRVPYKPKNAQQALENTELHLWHADYCER